MRTESPLYSLADMQLMQDTIARDLEALHSENQGVLDQVQTLVSHDAFQQIKDTLCDSGYTHGYLITDQPHGEPQDDGFVLGEVYVDQPLKDGFTGDDYAGMMSMPLAAGGFFQFNYAC
jgi:hypothetical protein